MSAAIAIERHGACTCSTDGAVVWHDRCPESSVTEGDRPQSPSVTVSEPGVR